MEEKAKEVAELLKVLANENRMLLLCALLEEPRTVGELVARLKGISQSAVSQHLALLKANGILDAVKKGQSITYFLRDDRIRAVMAVLKEQYCTF